MAKRSARIGVEKKGSSKLPVEGEFDTGNGKDTWRVMKASILIVSRDRKAELQKTLLILEECLQKEQEELLVYLDGPTDGSEELQVVFPWIRWYISKEVRGASKARNILYRKAKGDILFGFDDDSHPLQRNFIDISEELFAENKKVGILAFKEIKGDFAPDKDISGLVTKREDYLVKDFLGCGFALKRHVYNRTRGFPVWIDIYGEEVCLAMETLDLSYDILFTYKVVVSHRTQKQKKNIFGANYFRFGKQLKNTAAFYLVYYPFPLLLKKIFRLYIRNFQKYGSKDSRFFRKFLFSLAGFSVKIPYLLKYRKPVNKETIRRFNELKNPEY